MASDTPMTSEERWLAIEDLHTLCTRDMSVLYLPGHQPVHGCCPVKCCQLQLDSLSKSQRNQHVQACIRQEIASQREHLLTNVHYCHQSPDRRLESWSRDAALWQHVDTHLHRTKWPLPCPHPLCDVSLVDGQDLRFHFIDDHGLSRTTPQAVKQLDTTPSNTEQEQVATRRRKGYEGNCELSWLRCEQSSPERPPKKVRREPSTVAPSLFLRTKDTLQSPPPVIDLTASGSEESGATLDSEGEVWRTDDTEVGSKLPTRFGSCDSTLAGSARPDNNDDGNNAYCDFLRYIRSPSPDRVSADGEGTVVVDDRDSARVSRMPASQDATMATLDPQEDRSPPPAEARAKRRIYLLVGAKPKITLRLTAPKAGQPKKLQRQLRSQPMKEKMKRRYGPFMSDG